MAFFEMIWSVIGGTIGGFFEALFSGEIFTYEYWHPYG